MKTLGETLETKKPQTDILNSQLSAFQKVLDKAAKEKVIHKNKADRLKSRYAKKISAHSKATTSKPARAAKEK